MKCCMRNCLYFGKHQFLDKRLCCKDCDKAKDKLFKKCKGKCSLAKKDEKCMFSYSEDIKN